MKKIQPNEHDFRNAVLDAFNGWVKRVEKARGMGDGFPDLVLLLPSGLALCELKIGTIEDNILWTKEVRPSQIQFHRELANAGGQSFFLVGVWCGDHWRAFAFDGVSARQWEMTGFEVGQTCFEIDMSNLYESLTEYVFEQLES